ncbi:uncharacterized protein CTRU02_215025 [Colletotrichum truncatum]|uniref:Uncharacterized protein n=1 Tax=Colletotrichum truncatum TaxID=5467 RepID=A0ACC3YEG5_COLTU|nr:uncharacterized protein CTRU02_08222 [Colletotrichum truncatum]KAF6790093.1 hypothetical protein CTRU02_08222 [Colletotrichum truncatum]
MLVSRTFKIQKATLSYGFALAIHVHGSIYLSAHVNVRPETSANHRCPSPPQLQPTMCIRHIQFFECPSREGPSKRHRIKSNILCSNHHPCCESHWERRSSHYRYMCPGCSGEPPEVPREKPCNEHWERDVSEDEAWVQNHLDSLCNAVTLWAWGEFAAPTQRVSIREMARLYPAFYLERRCKEHDHRPSRCQCEANGPLSYLYNPATALRRRFTDETASAFARDPHLQSEHARQVFADVHRNLTAMCGDKNLYFKDGIARQPFFSLEAIEKRRHTMNRVVRNAWRAVEDDLRDTAKANEAGWTEAHTLMEVQALRRRNLVRFMGEILLYDNGISTAKFCLAIERLAHIIQMPQKRESSGIIALENLALVTSSHDREPRADEPYDELMKRAVSYFAGKRKTWAKEIRNYAAKRMLFEESTTLINGLELRALSGDDEGHDNCSICYVDYWEAPLKPSSIASPTAEQRTWPGRLVSQSSNAESNISNQIRRLRWDDDPDVQRRIFGANLSGVSMADHGEPAVRIKHCGHIFGRSCLFRAWVTEANEAGRRPACPYCRAEPPQRVYQIIESFVGARLTIDPGWHLPTFLLSLID